MGQYYVIANTDKKEFLCPYKFDNGAKLMEWSYIKNKMCKALFYLLNDRWKGDHVYVVGDYAAPDDPNEVWYSSLKKEMEKLGLPTNIEDEGTSLYSYIQDFFRDISKEVKNKSANIRYIYNTATEEYVDLKHCPIAWVWHDRETGEKSVAKINPLSLLLAMGNNRGGGDFRNDINRFVGSWCDTTDSIVVSSKKLDYDFEEFVPDFYKDKLIPYTEEKRLLEEEVEELPW